MSGLILPPGAQSSVPLDDGRTTRFVICFTCQTVEPVDDFVGPPEYDKALDALVSKHRYPNGDEHTGRMFRLPTTQWENLDVRAAVIKQIFEGGSKGIDEFDESFYASKEQYKADAMACYSAHLRPTDGCPDYMSDSKILLPNTKAERVELGMPTPAQAPGPKNHLCSFCPVHSIVQNKINDLKKNL